MVFPKEKILKPAKCKYCAESFSWVNIVPETCTLCRVTCRKYKTQMCYGCGLVFTSTQEVFCKECNPLNKEMQ